MAEKMIFGNQPLAERQGCSDRLSLEIPAEVTDAWRQDYDRMCRTMIYGSHPTWEVLMETIRQLNDKIRGLGYRK